MITDSRFLSIEELIEFEIAYEKDNFEKIIEYTPEALADLVYRAYLSHIGYTQLPFSS